MRDWERKFVRQEKRELENERFRKRVSQIFLQRYRDSERVQEQSKR